MTVPALRAPGTAQPTKPEPAAENKPENHADSASDATGVNPDDAVVPLVSADQIHGYLVQAFRNGNRERLRFVRLLNALEASHLYLELGHPNIAHYAERQFGMQRSETFEMLRVSRIIDELPACRDAFAEGRLSWSALKMITRVATTETEEAWLSFAAEHSRSELAAEVQDAVKKNRDRPRDDRFGLPNLQEPWVAPCSSHPPPRLRWPHRAVQRSLGMRHLSRVDPRRAARSDGRADGGPCVAVALPASRGDGPTGPGSEPARGDSHGPVRVCICRLGRRLDPVASRVSHDTGRRPRRPGRALVRLGLRRKDARSRVEHAWLKLKTRGEKPDPDRILTLAIAG
jgi:hypothetical protein